MRKTAQYKFSYSYSPYNKKAKQSRYTPLWCLGERRYSSYSFLTSALDWGEWSASRPAALCQGERTPGTHCIGGWMGPRAGLGVGCESVNWVHLARDKYQWRILETAIMNGSVTQTTENFLTPLATTIFSRKPTSCAP
jgi:hypothetical protein